jgi:hypothetical protein
MQTQGALLETLEARGMKAVYTGIDVVADMIFSAKARQPQRSWIVGDFLTWDSDRKYDFVVANGLLTQKMGTSIMDMNRFAQSLIIKMFDTCRIGVSFNMMSTFVNFQAPNLYYRSPSEMVAWCTSEVTPHVKLNAHYIPWFEYTISLFKDASE